MGKENILRKEQHKTKNSLAQHLHGQTTIPEKNIRNVKRKRLKTANKPTPHQKKKKKEHELREH